MSGTAVDAGALQVFKGALKRFEAEAFEAFETARLEIDRTFDWLEQHQRHCEKEIRRWEQELDYFRAQNARDPDGGYEGAVAMARHQLAEAEETHAKVRLWKNRIERDINAYKVQVAQLQFFLRNDIQNASASLSKSIDIVKSY